MPPGANATAYIESGDRSAEPPVPMARAPQITSEHNSSGRRGTLWRRLGSIAAAASILTLRRMTATITSETPDDLLLTMREAAAVTGRKPAMLTERYKAGRWPGGLMRDGKRHVPVRDLIEDGLLERPSVDQPPGLTTAAERHELATLRQRVVRLEVELEAADRRATDAEARIEQAERRADQRVAELEQQRAAWQEQATLALRSVQSLTGRGEQ